MFRGMTSNESAFPGKKMTASVVFPKVVGYMFSFIREPSSNHWNYGYRVFSVGGKVMGCCYRSAGVILSIVWMDVFKKY